MSADDMLGGLISRRINVDDKVGSKRTCYLLWGQYSDNSGQVFIGVYGTREKAEQDYNLILKAEPSYTLLIDAVEWRY